MYLFELDFFEDIDRERVMASVLFMKNNEFFDFVERNAGDIEANILRIQGINNVQSLLRSKDVFEIFQFDCEELQELKSHACLRLNDGNYMVRPAIRENMEYCVHLLNQNVHYQEQQQMNRLSMASPKLNTSSIVDKSLMSELVQNIIDNKSRSKHNYQYNVFSRRFASCLFALGGRNTYEFLRLNLPGLLPSIPTLESYENNCFKRFEEGEFRFDSLHDYLDKTKSNFVFGSEDCTGAVTGISYDADTNSFIGFRPTLRNGVPIMRQYQFEKFHQLKQCFETVKKSNLLNVHVIQPISNTKLPPFILSAYGTTGDVESISIIRRWLFIYQQCQDRGIRIVGYSTDADAKYVKAMRLALGEYRS